MSVSASWRVVAGIALVLGACTPPPERPKNLILISIDTLRADRLSCYGYERPTSPGLDALAASGVPFEDASAPSPWTLPSHATLFTGLYPRRNGVTGMKFSMAADVESLATVLARKGFATAGIATNSLLSSNGLDAGFETMEQVDKGGPHPSAVSARSIEWLSARDPQRPFFLLVHYIDPHTDYETLPEFRDRFIEPYDGPATGTSEQLYDFVEGSISFDEADGRHLSNLYDGAVAQLDDQIRRLCDYLREEGLLDETLLVITSDHGEEFLDHGGVLHGTTQFEELVRVPLIVVGPGVPPGLRIDVPVSLVDVMPTCLDMLGVEVPARLDGLPLRPVWRNPTGAPRRRIYFEADLDRPDAKRRVMVKGHDRAIRDGRYKLHYAEETEEVRLFDLQNDPTEQVDIQDAHPELVRVLLDDLQAFLAAGRDVPARELTEEDLDRLRELGYAGD